MLGFFLKILFIYFLREGEREKEREKNISLWLPLVCPSTGDMTCNPGMCPTRLGIEPVTLWFTGWHSIQWATPARAVFFFSWYHLFVLTGNHVHLKLLLGKISATLWSLKIRNKINCPHIKHFLWPQGTETRNQPQRKKPKTLKIMETGQHAIKQWMGQERD